MGPNETTIAICGGPRVIGVFDIHGCHRAQIKHFWGAQIASRTSPGLGLMMGSRLLRMRRCLELPRELWIQSLRDLDLNQMCGQALVHLYVAPEVPAHAV